MSNKKNNDISYLVDKAIENMDFDDLSKKIQRSIDTSIDFIRNSILHLDDKKNSKQKIVSKDPAICVQNPSSNSKASSMKFLGVLGMFVGICSLFSAFLSLASFFSIFSTISLFLFGGGCFIAGNLIFRKGNALQALNRRYFRYLREIQNETVVSVEDLSSAVQQSTEKTVADLQELIRKDYFLQARLVEDNCLFLLDKNTYQMYKNYQLDYHDTYTIPSNESLDEMDQSKYDKSMKEGKYYMSQIDQVKNSIQDQDLVSKIDVFETRIINILNCVEEDPTKIDALDRFLNYYLPTTLKLLTSFKDFEESTSEAPEIIEAKEEIKKSFDSINFAFDQILVQLFEDKTMDVKTDISVLKTMLNQDGLLGNELNRKD